MSASLDNLEKDLVVPAPDGLDAGFGALDEKAALDAAESHGLSMICDRPAKELGPDDDFPIRTGSDEFIPPIE